MYCIHVSNLQLNFLRNTIKQKNWSHYIKLPSALEFLAIHSSAKLLLPCPITNPQFIQSSKDCNQCKIRPQNLLQLESVHFVKQPTLFILGLTKMWFLIFKHRFCLPDSRIYWGFIGGCHRTMLTYTRVMRTSSYRHNRCHWLHQTPVKEIKMHKTQKRWLRTTNFGWSSVLTTATLVAYMILLNYFRLDCWHSVLVQDQNIK